jgi:hypothetical protein
VVLARAKELIGRTIRATDGDIGTAKNLYFDDEGWTVRYLVVDTGRWLPGRQVLISPYAVRDAGSAVRPIEVSVTREQVRDSPDVTVERPISRQEELTYADYYGYPYYWAGPAQWGAGAVPVWPTVPHQAVHNQIRAEREALRAHDERNSHLRDLKHVTGYHIRAVDGEIGHVDDFLIEDGSWTLRYLVVDTSNWIGGRHVLLAPRWVSAIHWETSQIEVTITRDAVARSPHYNPNRDVERSYEARLHAHYVQPPYWKHEQEVPNADPASSHAGLARLADLAELEVAAGDPDIRNWTAVTADGLTVGRVEHLIVDRAAMTVRYLEVGIDPDAAGGANRDVLIPLEYVDIHKSAHRVWLRGVQSSDVAALPSFTGPPIDPQLVLETRKRFATSRPDEDLESASGSQAAAVHRRR